jgi:AraC family transcriptional regulator
VPGKSRSALSKVSIDRLLAAQNPRIKVAHSRLYSRIARKLPDQVAYSSIAAGWSNDVTVERLLLPPTEGFESILTKHRFVVSVGSWPVFGTWEDEDLRGEGFTAPGAVHVIPQGMRTRVGWTERFDIASFEFSSAMMVRLLDGCMSAPSEQLISRRCVPDRVAYDLTRRIVAELARPTECLYGDTLCLALAVHLLRQYGRAQVRALRFRGRLSAVQAHRVLDYIHANLDGRLSVAALAREAGLSDAYFARAFRATFHEAPHRVVLRWRLERAARLLATTDCSLANAATSVGFCDQAHLTNAMRRHFGRTPGALVRRRKHADSAMNPVAIVQDCNGAIQ